MQCILKEREYPGRPCTGPRKIEGGRKRWRSGGGSKKSRSHMGELSEAAVSGARWRSSVDKCAFSIHAEGLKSMVLSKIILSYISIFLFNLFTVSATCW